MLTPKQDRLVNYLKKVLSDVSTEIIESQSEEFDDAVFTALISSHYYNNNLDFLATNIKDQQSLADQNFN